MAYESYSREYDDALDDGIDVPQQQQEPSYDPSFVPDAIRTFVVFLYRQIREKNVYEIHQMYEGSFQKLSERMFKESPWPSVEAIAPYVDNDHVFCLLYREMWYRHLYARLQPTLKQRFESWDNYCSLFQVILHGVVNMQLPNQWLWDMIDEFIYQFQSFCQYRAKLRTRTDQELSLLRQYDEVAETRFASHTIVMRRLLKVKDALSQMVIGHQWGVWKISNSERAQRIRDLILNESWWARVAYVLDFTKPIMTMLRFADTDTPCLGDVYDGMDTMVEKVKHSIQAHESDPTQCEALCIQVQAIINHRWNKMTTPLHLLAYALSPRYYSEEIAGMPGRVAPFADEEVAEGCHKALSRLFPLEEMHEKVREEFGLFASGLKHSPFALKDQNRMGAITWWYMYGQPFKHLQPLAIKVLSQVWNVYGVLNYLQALVEKSMIIQILEEEKDGNLTFTATDGYDYNGGSNVLKVLGYFSIVGLLRVHCLLGDYYSGLKCLAPIDVNQTGVYNSVIGSHITTIYYYGFANLMLRRYVEAIKAFNQVLLYIIKTKQFHQKSPQFDQILKKNEQMYALLAICLSLCPQVKLVEENVNNQLREKYGEKMLRMQRSDEVMYDELFSYACPKFITPAAPSYDEPLVNYNQDAYRLQLKLFLSEVRQQQLLSGVRSFIKMYTSISIEKLANFMDVDESTLRTTLMTYKHKTHAIDHNGKVISNADIDFYIDEDIVHIIESKTTKRYADHFMRHIIKFEEVISDLERVKLE